MSVFIGKTLSAVLDELEEKVSDQKMTPDEKTELKLDIIGKIPEILLDNNDRNRTSPFAFTGNRFEFRAVGSSGNCASPLIVLNTAVADQLNRFKVEVEKVIEKGVKKDEAIIQCLRKVIIESKKIASRATATVRIGLMKPPAVVYPISKTQLRPSKHSYSTHRKTY
jgi:glutamine synthetase